MAISSLYPTIRPSLNLNFAKAKRLDPRITFTRNSTGTYTDAQGILRTAGVNEPRFDHNPTTGECLGLLVEEQRQNLLLRSEEFDDISWTKTTFGGTGSAPVVTANYALAPNGLLEADRLQADRGAGNTSSDFSVLQQNVAGLANPHTVTLSIWIKSNTGVNQEVYFRNTTGAGGSVVTVTPEWRRYTVTSADVAFAYDVFQIGSRGTLNTSGSVDILLWGAQLEAGAFPTSYIKTEAAAATRTADIASISGSNYIGWFNGGEFTVFTDLVRSYSGNFTGFPTPYNFHDGSDSNRALVFGTSNIYSNLVTSGGVSQLDFVATGITQFPVPNRIAHSLKANFSSLVFNGVATAQDTTVVMPVGINALAIGSARSGLQWNGSLRRITYWPRALSTPTLQSITL